MTLIDKIKRDREAGMEPITAEQTALLAADELAEALENYRIAEEEWGPAEDGVDAAFNIIEQWEAVAAALAAWNAATKGDRHD